MKSIYRFMYIYLISKCIMWMFRISALSEYEQIGWKEVLLDVVIFAIGFLFVEGIRILAQLIEKTGKIELGIKVLDKGIFCILFLLIANIVASSIGVFDIGRAMFGILGLEMLWIQMRLELNWFQKEISRMGGL